MAAFDYDMLVLGSGPAGQRAAIQAAKLGKRVAVAERTSDVGGVCINTGTIPSKTLREAVLYLSGYRERGIYGESYAVKRDITMADLMFRADHVMRNEIDVVRHQLIRNRVEVVNAEASFVDPHTVRLKDVQSRSHREVTADTIMIATGTAATKDGHIPFDGERILSSDEILQMDALPRTLAVVGAGVLARLGEQTFGNEAGRFYAPHAIAVDSRGDIYLAESSISETKNERYGGLVDRTQKLRSLQKFVRVG